MVRDAPEPGFCPDLAVDKLLVRDNVKSAIRSRNPNWDQQGISLGTSPTKLGPAGDHPGHFPHQTGTSKPDGPDPSVKTISGRLLKMARPGR